MTVRIAAAVAASVVLAFGTIAIARVETGKPLATPVK